MNRVRALHALLILAAVTVAAAYFRLPGVERSMFRDWADDAFFYVVVADHIVAGQGSTSDGIGATNGYHPAWMTVHVATRWLFGDPLRALAVIQFALLAIALWLLYRILAERTGRTVALLAALVASFETTYAQVLGAGMETGLAFVALLATLWSLRDANLETLTTRRRLALQGSLTLLFFARLDGALVWIALAAVALLEAHGASGAIGARARTLARIFAPPFVLAGGYLLFNAIVFGTAMPISGRIKALGWSEAVSQTASSHLARAMDHLVVLWGLQTFPLPFGLSLYDPRHDALHATVWILYLSLCALGIVIFARDLARRGSLDLQMKTLLAGVALHTTYYALLQKDRYALSWARGPELLLLTMVLAWLASRIAARMPARDLPRRAVAAAAVAAVFVLLFATSRAKVDRAGVIRDFNTAVSAFDEGVAYIRAHTRDDEIIASESIGFLGHYSRRRIVSLDGLLNSADYYRRYLKTGRVGDYLREHHVRYVAQGMRKDEDPVPYMSRLLDIPAGDIRVVAAFDGPARIPRRYVVLRIDGPGGP